MRSWKNISISVLLISSCFLLLSCGGGESSGGGGQSSRCPDDLLSQDQRRRRAARLSSTIQREFFSGSPIPSSHQPIASVTGLSPVPDGTLVQLIRLNATGTSFTVLASTTTTGGRYTFNPSHLGLQPSNDLAVPVGWRGSK